MQPGDRVVIRDALFYKFFYLGFVVLAIYLGIESNYKLANAADWIFLLLFCTAGLISFVLFVWNLFNRDIILVIDYDGITAGKEFRGWKSIRHIRFDCYTDVLSKYPKPAWNMVVDSGESTEAMEQVISRLSLSAHKIMEIIKVTVPAGVSITERHLPGSL